MTLGLKDTTAYTFIKPINDIKKVDEILIVRDFPGPRFSKVTYYCPPNRISKLPIIKLFFKIWLMLLLCIRKRPTIIIAINLYMYGVVSFYVGKIFKIPTIVSIIAGKREVSRLGTLVELFLLGLLKNYDGITVTGKGTKDFQKMCILGSYVFDYLPKPLDAKQLISSVERCNRYFYSRNA